MNVLMVCAELAPLAKVGGLADAVSGLSGALGARGHDVRILLPRYGASMAAEAVREVPGDLSARYRFLEVEAPSGGPRIYLLDAPEIFTDDRIYLEDDRDAERFLLLCGAAMSLGPTIGWQPQVFHCHDWHTALVAPLLRSSYAPPGTEQAVSALSLHNIAFQGVFPASVLAQSGHAELSAFFEAEELARSSINFLRAGIRAADGLFTVSPTYAQEIQTPEQGMGLESLLHAHRGKLVGILNGVDYRVWEPSVDPYIEHNYDADDVAAKRLIKEALCRDLGIAGPADAPLIGLVSRLVWQKGIDLLVEAMPLLLAQSNARFAFLGTGEPPLVQAMHDLAAAHAGRVSFTAGHAEPLAHRILAGSDIVLLPSRYEPCGLTQLYGLRYGTVPVVRATGGLADTIRPFDPASGHGNGSVFGPYAVGALVEAVERALAWYANPGTWRRVVANAMRDDYSWEHQAPAYEEAYRRLLEGRADADPMKSRG